MVADRAHGRLDGDRDEGAEQLEDADDRPGRAPAHDELDLLLPEALVGAPDRVDAEPVHREDGQLPDGQQGRGAGAVTGDRARHAAACLQRSLAGA